jgi:hypothetical protein
MSTIETLVDVLARVINPTPSHERLVDLGWISPSGESLSWENWCTGSRWYPVWRKIQ